MPIESANYVSQLDPANPAAPDLLADTDNHLRMIKQALRNTFPNLSSPVTASPAQMMGFTPIGGIIMWPFPVNTIPAGWALCNGQTVARSDGGGNITTPYLHDRFIKGVSASLADLGTFGGAQALSGTALAGGTHTHTGWTDVAGFHAHGGETIHATIGVNQMPRHAHGFTAAQATSVSDTSMYVWIGGGIRVEAANSLTDYQGGGEGHAHGIYGDGNHAHNLVVSYAPDHVHGVNIPDGRPLFYSLCFIMKV